MSRKNWTNEKLFFRLVNNKSEKTYWDNIQVLRSRPTKETFSQCKKFLKSKGAKKRTIAVDVMAQLGLPPRPFYEETVQLLFGLLEKETNEKVIWSTLYALGHNNEGFNEAQILLLRRFQNNENTDIRHALVCALLGVEDRTAIDTLIYLAKDKDPSTRDWATFGLGSQIETDNEEIRQALWERTNDKDKTTRFEAIAGLAQRKDPRVKSILKNELEQIDGQGSIILESIGSYGDKDFIQLLEKQIALNKITNQVNEKWLLDSLETIKTNT